MSRIFISHSSRDNAQAAALRDWLAAHGWDDVFLDFDPVRGLTPGERWMEALRQAADRCEAVICLLSDAWLVSEWCEDEARLAWHMGKLIIGVQIEDLPLSRIPSWMTGEWMHVNLAAPGGRTALHTRVPPDNAPHTVEFHAENMERLRLGLEKAGLGAESFLWPPQQDPDRAPYRGLLPLEAEDAGIFFGRDAQIVRGFDQLRNLREEGGGCLMVILGASGAGKSSFLRAGLLPRLARDDRHFLPLPVIRPESAALTGEQGLVSAVEKACAAAGLGVSRAEIRREVEQGADAVAQRLAALQAAVPIVTMDAEAKPQPPTIFLPIDQGEELFAATGNGEGRRFLKLLANLLKGSSDVIACCAMRSDSYRLLQEAPEIAGVRQVPFNLPPVQRGAYQEIIEGPAAALPGPRRLEIVPGLTERLLIDLEHGGGADPLPLLAFTLERLYADYGGGGRLELAHYEALGGLAGSIAASVEAAIAAAQAKGAAPAGRTEALGLLRRAFIPWLCRVDPATRLPLRRVARRDEIPPEALGLVDELIERRLLVSSMRTGGPGAQSLIDIAHESLLRQWPLLHDWLAGETGALLILDGVQRAAADWAEAGRKDPAFLLHRGGRLEDALDVSMRRDMAEALGKEGRDYLNACQADERRRRTARRRRQRRIAAGLTAFAVLIAIAGFVTLNQSREVSRNLSLLFAQKAQEANDRGDYAKGLLWALAGLPQPGELMGPTGPQARAQLLRAYHNNSLLRTLRGHKGWASYTAFSGDGKRMVTGFRDGITQVWEVETGAVLATLTAGDGSQVIHAAFSPDGTRLATLSNVGTARIWNVKSGAILQTLGDRESGISAVLSPDGRRLAKITFDRKVHVWDVGSGRKVHVWDSGSATILKSENRYAPAVIALSPDSASLVTTSGDGTAWLWDVETGGLLQILEGHENAIRHAAFSPDGMRLATASEDHTARLWDVASGLLLKTLKGHEDIVTQAFFSPDGAHLLTASRDRTARLWDAKTGTLLATLEAYQSPIRHAVFSSDSSHLVTVSGGLVQLWDVKTGTLLQTFVASGDLVQHADLSPTGERLITAGYDGAVKLWKVTNDTVHTLDDLEWPFRSVLSPAGQRLATISRDGTTVSLWNVHTGALLRTYTDHSEPVYQAAFSSGGKRLVTVSAHTANLWDSESGRKIEVLRHAAPNIISLPRLRHAAFSPDGKRLVTAIEDGLVWIWDAERGKILRLLITHVKKISHVAFAPEGQRLVTASHDKTARLWDLEMGQLLHTFEGHGNALTSAAFSPDGTKVVTTSYDATARLWDTGTGALLQIFHCRGRGVSDNPAFSPDGRRLAINRFNSMELWDIQSTTHLYTARNVGHGAIRFSSDGIRLITGPFNLRDARTGAVLHGFKDYMRPVGSTVFSTDGKDMVTVFRDATVRHWALPRRYERIATEPKIAGQVRVACEMARETGVTRFSEREMREPILHGRSPNPCDRHGMLSLFRASRSWR